MIIACLSGAFAVITGAFGAHSLADVLQEEQLQSYKTGVQYQFYHTLALMLTAWLSAKSENRWWINLAGWLFSAGIICFSGSIYLLALREILGISSLTPVLGPATPLGGLMFIAGWLSLARGMWQVKSS